MLKLYTYSACPYCSKVRSAFESMKIEFEEVDAERGTSGAEELMNLGGKQQVPFLLDEETGVSMYESTDIIDYARKRFAKN